MTGLLRRKWQRADPSKKRRNLPRTPTSTRVSLFRRGQDSLPLTTPPIRTSATPSIRPSKLSMISPVNFYGEDGIDFSHCAQISGRDHAINRKKTDITTGDLILHRIGAGLGRVRIVQDWMPEFSILHSLAMIRADQEMINERFLNYAFQTKPVQDQLGIGTQSIGVPDLGLDKIANTFFPRPKSQGEQIKIADFLDSWKIRFNQEVGYRSKLLSLKQGLMQDLLTGRVRVKVQAEKAAC